MASFFDRVRNALTKNAQQSAQEYNKAIYNWLGESILWNRETDDTYIKEGYQKNATIYSLINIITKAATTIPFQVYEKTNDADYKRYKSLTSGTLDSSALYKADLLRKRSLVELEGTPLHELLENPNATQSYSSWLTELIAFRKLTGNGYIYGISPETGISAGKYKELYVMPSQIMEIISGGMMTPVKEYTIEYNGTHRIPAEFICHIKDFNPYVDGTGSHLYGQSPLQAGLRAMTTNNEAVTTGVKYLQNQTARGILMSEEGDINEVQAQQLKDKFRRQHQGSTNAGDILITPKKLSWVNFGLSASDLSLIEQYNASIKDLCNVYGVPVQLLNNTDASTYNNMKEAKKALYQNAVIPELLKIKDELNRWLAPQFGDKICIEFDFTAIPELQEETEKVVDQLAKAWWITPNEKREMMSYGMDEESEALNDYYIPANLVPVKNVDLPEMPMAEPPVEESTQEEATKDFFLTKAEVTAAIEKGLKKKVDDHNEKHGDDPAKRATLRMLIACFVRGIGAYRTNPSSVRPSVNSEEQWAYARVNSLLYALRNGRFRSGRHDLDLLPEEHPMSSKDKMQKAETFDDYPQGATNNAKRMLEWREKYGRDVVQGGTRVGWERANQLANREPLSLDTVRRINSFLARHEENAIIAEEFKGEPWKDKGYVAYNLWGGSAMVSWAKRISENNA